MPKLRGVSGFWLDIKALDSDRMHLVAEHGAKEGMLLFGVWVAIFTWQYRRAAPVTGPMHVAQLTGLNIRTAQRLLQSLTQSLPQSLVQRSGQWYCKRTLQVLEKIETEQWDAGATNDRDFQTFSDPDPDPDLLPSLSPSQDSRSGGSDKRPTEKKKSKPKEKSARFQRPTARQVADYCAERNNQVDPEAWMAHYVANGFRVGRNPMKDWKAAVRTWERNGIDHRRTDTPRTKDEYDAKLEAWAESGRDAKDGRVDPGETGEVLEGDGEPVR